MTQQESVQENTILVDGVRVHYWKSGAGPALVMLHGLVGSALNWQENIEFLGQFRTVYALDHANMGESQRVRGLDAGLEASADRVAACMDALEIPQADVAGHSHGGAIAMMLAARHPARVRSLILFAPANPFCKAALPWVRFYMSPVGKATALVMPFVPKLVHIRAMHRMYGDPARVTEEHFAGYKTQLDLGCVRHVLGILRSWRSDMQQLERAMHQLATVPTLLIWGELDSAVSPRSGQRLAEVLGARLVVLPGVGHVAFAERPELCNPLFGEWMSRPDAA